MLCLYHSHQFIEVEVVQLHDLSLVPQRCDLLVLVELHDRESWAREGELNGVAPDLALVGNARLGVVLWKNIHHLMCRSTHRCLSKTLESFETQRQFYVRL